jgi:hypothetical protein
MMRQLKWDSKASPEMRSKTAIKVFVVIEPEPNDDHFRSYFLERISSTIQSDETPSDLRFLQHHRPVILFFCWCKLS